MVEFCTTIILLLNFINHHFCEGISQWLEYAKESTAYFELIPEQNINQTQNAWSLSAL